MSPHTYLQFARRNKVKLLLPGAVLGAVLVLGLQYGCTGPAGSEGANPASPRQRLSLDMDWRFTKGDPASNQVSLLYDVRPAGRGGRGRRGGAAATPTNEVATPTPEVIKQWVLPTGNDLIKDPAQRYTRPAGNLGGDVAYVKPDYDDSSWRKLNLPHDWGIEGPWDPNGNGGTGKLPFFGIAWYRKSLEYSGFGRGQIALSGGGRRDGLRHRVVERPVCRRLALRV